MATRYGERVPTSDDHWVAVGGLKGGYRNCCDGTMENGCDVMKTKMTKQR